MAIFESTSTQLLIEQIRSKTGDQFRLVDAEKYANYCLKILSEKKDGQVKNPWFQKRTIEELEAAYRRVLNEGLRFDGVHVTYQQTGISYDYQAYKNKMLITYPESIIDLQLVYEGDKIEFSKDSGSVNYTHVYSDPFSQDDSKIIGGYCVIKNRRGEFLTTLSKDRIELHRKVAKTDFIWKQWFPEMCLKTIIRKATKYHFEDVFQSMNEAENDHSDLEMAGRSKLEKLNLQIVDLMTVYQGEDLSQIRLECLKAKESNSFTEDFAESIINKLGGK